ncbi:MAG: AAA family ATPase, partial [Anaeroplasmataceae bacterium]|nr:AAA family ATPase [Anaeroplasmataceae bacterium]
EFDACPAFTELDSRLEEFKQSLEERRKNLFENLTLPNLVRFIVDYARECRLHLSYSLEDIATFVAGLGASRLSILQGMSGTGKTSLPKIFAEAIMGTCEVVEVESSWRDKNELLGYYNEFSKCFTPKKFTQCLYKARLNAEVPTFIVLDEMNLSRIEYYFSDFLSLMEHEEDKRQIKLLNVKLTRKSQGESYEYYGLTHGHTILIPTNVWFIGTANRDESTFEISDKVYDRAQTMNFNKRAPKIHSFSEPLPQRYVPYDAIANLFEEAKANYTFEAEDDPIVQKVEKLLLPFNISFGNRILKQMEEFVKIYCACFGDKNAVVQEAVEKILLSKVVSKLEYKIVENKEVLAVEFDKLGLTACSAFVRKLNED